MNPGVIVGLEQPLSRGQTTGCCTWIMKGLFQKTVDKLCGSMAGTSHGSIAHPNLSELTCRESTIKAYLNLNEPKVFGGSLLGNHL